MLLRNYTSNRSTGKMGCWMQCFGSISFLKVKLECIVPRYISMIASKCNIAIITNKKKYNPHETPAPVTFALAPCKNIIISYPTTGV